MYVAEFMKDVKSAVTDPGYVVSPFGRRRRFGGAEINDTSIIAAMQREAGNFPIQSTVADILNSAAYALWLYRHFHPDAPEFKIVLAIHDALLVECAARDAHRVATALSMCMCSVKVPHFNFSLEVDVDVFMEWGIHPRKEDLIARGMPEEHALMYAAEEK